MILFVIFTILSGIFSLIFLLVLRAKKYYQDQSASEQSHTENLSGNFDVLLVLDIDLNRSLSRLQKAISYKTVSYEPGKYEREELADFVNFIIAEYKNVHSCPWIKWKIINNYSLFYHVISDFEEKQENSLGLYDNKDHSPWMLIAHSDVVPVSEGDSKLWTAPAFSGEVIESNGKKYLCGRGSLDAKHILCANLECLDIMVQKNLRLRDRSLFLAFGHDEEVGGYDGASHIAKHLVSYLKQQQPSSVHQNLSDNGNDEKSKITDSFLEQQSPPPLAFILDEGTNIFTDVLPEKKLALIGVSEKVSCTLKLTARTSSGHSSIPKPGSNAIATLARAITRLQSIDYKRPVHPDAKRVEAEFLKQISPHLFPRHATLSLPSNVHELKNVVGKVLFANFDLCPSLALNLLSYANPLIGSLFKTVSCVTKCSGGIKENVVPSEAEATFLMRIHPAQTISEIMDINEKVINDTSISLESHAIVPKIPISNFNELTNSTQTNGFWYLKDTIIKLFPDTVVAPIIMPGGTDSKHFVGLARDIYRFSPVEMSTADLRGVHGVDEKIAVDSYEKFLHWYYKLYQTVSGFQEFH